MSFIEVFDLFILPAGIIILSLIFFLFFKEEEE